VADHGLCTSTNNLSVVTQGSAKSCSRSALARAGDGTDDRIIVHPLTTRLSRKQERYVVVDAYISCCLDIHLSHRWATLAMIAGRMRKREVRRGRAAPDRASSPTQNQGRWARLAPPPYRKEVGRSE
jgi:hypothetical protein